MSTGAVGDGTRYVVHVLRRVAGHLLAVTRSHLVRFLTPSRCGRSHSARCPRRPECCRARSSGYHGILGTFLDAPRLWEIALGTLPTSSGVLPGSPVLLPGRLGHASRVQPGVTPPVLHGLFWSRTSGGHDAQGLPRGRASNEHARRGNPRGRQAPRNGRTVRGPVRVGPCQQECRRRSRRS